MNRPCRRRNGWLVLLCLLGTSAAAAQEGAGEQQGTGTEPQLTQYADASIRFGFGGFRDNRSPDGDVGGSQIALDIRPIKLPITF
ncbi:MAG: hypothetical protein HKN42_01275, partial [Granulosicoccus sp.]|nr:hypothetical protein [Granulosicoccus sp.]